VNNAHDLELKLVRAQALLEANGVKAEKERPTKSHARTLNIACHKLNKLRDRLAKSVTNFFLNIPDAAS
jgi:hypothetical protein